jgi:hypothetical protein
MFIEIFRHHAVPGPIDGERQDPLPVQDIAKDARKFTVQIICTLAPEGHN